eukprot:CFRG6314T1
MITNAKLIILFILVAAYCVKLTIERKRKLPPGPFSLPWIGTLGLVFNLHRFDDYLMEMTRKYGRTFSISFVGNDDAIMVTEPGNVEHVLSTNFKNYIKGPRFREVFTELLGNGIFNSDGPAWAMQRKVASHMFSTKTLREDMMPVFSRHIEEAVEILNKVADSGEVIDMQKLFLDLTLNSVAEIAFGCDLLGQKNTCLDGFGDAFDLAQRYSVLRYLYPYWRIARYFQFGSEVSLSSAITDLNECVATVIKNRRKLAVTKELESCTDLLSRFMSIRDENGHGFNDSYLHSVVTNYMVAGRDTTANAMTWALYNLCTNPEVETGFVKEIALTLGDGMLPSYECVKKMEYVQAIVMETLRLYPSVPRNLKYCVADDYLPDGTFVPAGTSVGYLPHVQGRMESVWGMDAEKFKPERFIRKYRQDMPTPFEFIAFQAGPRTCLGINMAYLEAKLTLINLFQKFKFELVNNEKPAICFTLTSPMIHGLPVRVSKRPSIEVE